MDLTEEIKIVFDELKNVLPKSKDITDHLDNSYDKIIALICKKNKNIYSDLIYQLTPVPLSNIMEKSS